MTIAEFITAFIVIKSDLTPMSRAFNVNENQSIDMIVRDLKEELADKTTFNKQFFQIMGRSGGIILACCEHRVTCAIKLPL